MVSKACDLRSKAKLVLGKMEEPVDRIDRPLGKMLWQNFLGGIAWGLGVTVGLAVVFAILGFIITRVDFVPIVGGFFQQILPYLNPELPRPPDVILFDQ